MEFDFRTLSLFTRIIQKQQKPANPYWIIICQYFSNKNKNWHKSCFSYYPMNTQNDKQTQIVKEDSLKKLKLFILSQISCGQFYGIDLKLGQLHRAILKKERI